MTSRPALVALVALACELAAAPATAEEPDPSGPKLASTSVGTVRPDAAPTNTPARATPRPTTTSGGGTQVPATPRPAGSEVATDIAAPTPSVAAAPDDVEDLTVEEVVALVDVAPEDADADDLSTEPEAAPVAVEDRRVEGNSSVVRASRHGANRISGSAHQVKQRQLEQFEYDDIQRVMKQVPGVVVREEDGFGLRPNIGMRGAASDRSAKVSLMEDGVLFAPAPYAAPAAYYFPMTQRLSGVEVFKGPASVQYGPNTVGGAVNVLTRRIPGSSRGELDLAGGMYGTAKAHGWWGTSNEWGGILLEGVRLQSDGFKQLDGGGDTGFERTELMLKGRLQTDPKAAVYQRLELKLGWSDETSHETYLGLTADDLRATPHRRYAASRNDLMESWRTQAVVQHVLSVGDFELRTTAYRHDQHRLWDRLDAARDEHGRTVLLSDVLASPDAAAHRSLFRMLTGGTTAPGDASALVMAGNGRWFASQGVQTVGTFDTSFLGTSHTLEFGARLHYDRIRRNHTGTAYRMDSGVMVPTGERWQSALNTGEALAGAFHLRDEIGLGPVLLTPGARVELIHTRFVDDLGTGELPAGAAQESFTTVVIPGIGAAYTPFEGLTFLGGVHRGFSPVAPGQSKDTRPETSISSEAGARVTTGPVGFELVGFFNAYENLVQNCTGSSGCVDDDVNTQFSGRRANVYGVEATVGTVARLPGRLKLTADLHYTLTVGEFLDSFRSSLPTWGTVTAGDAIPYLPMHQGALVVTLGSGPWSLGATATYVGEMRDRAGRGAIRPGQGTDAQLLLDLVGSWKVSDAGRLYAKLDNATNSTYLTSYRPFGTRPNSPLTGMVGYKHSFGE